jgi:ABC-type multidrug transport system fused ATPase/permease subunit
MPEALAHAMLPPDGATPPSADARANLLYVGERERVGAAEALGLMVRSWRFIREHRRLVAIKCVLAFSSLTFFLMTPWPVKIVIDNVIDARPLTGVPARLLLPLAGQNRILMLAIVASFLLAAAILIGIVGDEPQELHTDVRSGELDQAALTANQANDGWSLWNGLFGYLEALVTIDLTQRINQDLRTAVYERFLRSPLPMYADQKIGDAVFRVMHDSAAIGAVLYRGVLAPLMSIFVFVLTMAILWAEFSSQPLIPVFAAITLPLVALGSGLFGRLLRDQSREMRERGSDVMAAFEERVAHVQLIKAFGQEERERAHVDRASWGSYVATLRMLALIFAVALVLVPFLGFLFMVLLYNLMMQVIHNRITLGDVVLLLSYASLLTRPMTVIGSTWAEMQAPAAGLRRIFSVLDRLGEQPAMGDGAGTLPRLSELEFRDVSVGYHPSAPVLEHVSFKLRAGEMAALAGASGCGKSTLIFSIPGFLRPSAGAILLDGIDAARLPTAAIRDRIGFVFQQEALFSASIGDNIRYGAQSAAPAAIERAAQMADAAEFVRALPEGYDTMLGRRGARLSVGQKQRIAIARALIRNPELLILDEPTAPLDPATEADLIRTLRGLARDRIVLIVGHRPETLAACDRVIFIHGGTVAACGTHQELLATCAAYRDYLAVTESEIQA